MENLRMVLTVRRAAWMGLLLALLSEPALAGTTVTVAVRDAAGAAVPKAVVYLQGTQRGPLTTSARVTVDQRDKAFVPEVTIIQVGTEVSFPNSDSVSHHVYSFAQPNVFELPLYKGKIRPAIRFDHAGVVTLGCNIHDSMVGYIVVVDTPYHGMTDGQGSVTVGDVAPGSYEVYVWSPRLDPANPVQAAALTVTGAPQSQTIALKRRLRSAPATGSTALAGSDY